MRDDDSLVLYFNDHLGTTWLKVCQAKQVFQNHIGFVSYAAPVDYDILFCWRTFLSFCETYATDFHQVFWFLHEPVVVAGFSELHHDVQKTYLVKINLSEFFNSLI